MKAMRTIVAIAAIFSASATAADAQVTYSTLGKFTSATPGCSGAIATLTANCLGSGFNILFEGTTGTSIADGSIASLGTFKLTDMNDITLAPGTYTFALVINQTSPIAGTGSFVGSIFGQLVTGAGGTLSTIEWDPNQTITLGSAVYTLIFDNNGPAAGRGLGLPINNMRGINALLQTSSVVPEPSVFVLLAGGLLALLSISGVRRTHH
jgi:hypothetical protein